MTIALLVWEQAAWDGLETAIGVGSLLSDLDRGAKACDGMSRLDVDFGLADLGRTMDILIAAPEAEHKTLALVKVDADTKLCEEKLAAFEFAFMRLGVVYGLPSLPVAENPDAKSIGSDVAVGMWCVEEFFIAKGEVGGACPMRERTLGIPAWNTESREVEACHQRVGTEEDVWCEGIEERGEESLD